MRWPPPGCARPPTPSWTRNSPNTRSTADEDASSLLRHSHERARPQGSRGRRHGHDHEPRHQHQPDAHRRGGAPAGLLHHPRDRQLDSAPKGLLAMNPGAYEPGFDALNKNAGPDAPLQGNHYIPEPPAPPRMRMVPGEGGLGVMFAA